MMNKLVDTGEWVQVNISFSAQTNAKRTQETIESKLDKKNWKNRLECLTEYLAHADCGQVGFCLFAEGEHV